MNKLIFALAIVMLFALSLTAMADEYNSETEKGIIAEIIFHRGELANIPYTVGTQTEYDFNTNNWGFYSKVTIDLSPLTKKLTEK